MKRLSEQTNRIAALALAVTMLATTILSTVTISVVSIIMTTPNVVYADSTVTMNFTTTTNWTVPSGVCSVKVLVVGGGGGGGGCNTWAYAAGGGGAGGVVYNASYPVTSGEVVTVTIGGSGGGGSGNARGGTGGNSVFGNSSYAPLITAYGGGGGGGGGCGGQGKGGDGGSGGGGSAPTSGCDPGNATHGGDGNEGHNGGKGHCCDNGGGGGGGSVSAGADSSSGNGGNGGDGADYSTGSYFNTTTNMTNSGKLAGGGGGGVYDSCCIGNGGLGGGGNGGRFADGVAATAHTGSGGGGASENLAAHNGGAGADGVIIIQYTLAPRTLTITSGDGGTITAPATSPKTYCLNQVVTITATANSSCYAFVNWSGNTSPIGNLTANSTNITMTADNTIVATFRWNCFNLTTIAGTGGTITAPASSPSTHVNGTVVTITAVPNPCYAFVNWSGNTSPIGNLTANSTNITMTANNTITANFKWNCYYLTTSSGDGGNVTTPATEGSHGPYSDGQSVTITATADTCYAFVNWSGSGISNVNNPNASTTTITMNGNYSIVANFRYNCFNLNTSSGDGGNVSTPGEGTFTGYTNGSSYPIVATADTCYAFVNWSGDTTYITDKNASSTTITMNGNYSIVANFRSNCYNLTVSAGTGGTVPTPGIGTFAYTTGTVVNLSATPGECYSFDSWSGNIGTIANPIGKSTTITINDSYSIHANFALNTTILTVSANNSSRGLPYFIGSNPFECGAIVDIAANTSPGFFFNRWSPADGVTDASKANTSVLLTQNRNIIAYYDTTAGPTPTPTPTPAPGSVITTTTYLTWHVTNSSFRLYSQKPNYIVANITASVNSSMGEYIEKQLTIYIKQRAEQGGLGRGGIWGESAIVGLDSLTIPSTGEDNMLNGDIYAAAVSVKGAGNRVTGTLYNCSRSTTGAGVDFRVGANGPCPNITMPYIGTPADYLAGNNMSVGILDYINNVYIFTGSSTELKGINGVWENNNPNTHHLRDGYYYSAGAITLTDHSTTGKVTFIANQIIIKNDETGYDLNGAIQIEPYNPDDLLLWATGSGSNSIWIRDTGSADWNACVNIQGILFAPYGEIELEGGGSYLPQFAKPFITKGAIIGKSLTISGSSWYIYRW